MSSSSANPTLSPASGRADTGRNHVSHSMHRYFHDLMAGFSLCARTSRRAARATAAVPPRGSRPSWALPTPRYAPAHGSLQDVRRSYSPRARRETPVAGRCAWPRYRLFRRDFRDGSRPRDSSRFQCFLGAFSLRRRKDKPSAQLGTYRRSEERIGVASTRQCIIKAKSSSYRPMHA